MAKKQNVIAGYQLTAKIGEGPHGRVYKGKKEGEDAAQAVKVIKSELVPKSGSAMAWLKKLLAELPHLKHPNIVTVFEGGFHGKQPYIAMQLVNGKNLADVVAADGPLEEKQGLKMLNQLSQALKLSHEWNLIHGDLKPENVFLCEDGRFRLSDFALAQALTEEPPPEDFIQQFKLVREDVSEEEGEKKMTAEDLFKKRGKSMSSVALDHTIDMLGLAELFLFAYGQELPERTRLLKNYRSQLIDMATSLLAEEKLSGHIGNIVRRLAAEDGYESIDSLVIDLISARVFSRQSFPGHVKKDEIEEAQKESTVASGAATAEPQVSKTTTQSLDRDDIQRQMAEIAAQQQQHQPAAPVAGPEWFLYIWHDEHEGLFYLINPGEKVAIGRDPDQVDIPILDKGISRRHCVIENREGKLVVKDAGSSNGTFVNGERVEEQELKPDDQVKVGAARLYLQLQPSQAKKK